MPIKKALKPYERKSEYTKDLKPRLQVVEEILMYTTPKWNWKKFTPQMTLQEACEKAWISYYTFRDWKQADEKIRRYVQEVKAARKESTHTMMEEFALNNVMEGISWAVKLRPMDKINVSLRYLEKTSPEFNPAIKVEMEAVQDIAVTMSTSEMERRIMELQASLKNNNKVYDNDDSIGSSTTTDEE